jgi:hypothetical protein
MGPVTNSAGINNRPTGSPLWECPVCRRQFANANQSHACGIHDLDHHFQNRPPEIRALYNAISNDEALLFLSKECFVSGIPSEATKLGLPRQPGTGPGIILQQCPRFANGIIVAPKLSIDCGEYPTVEVE